MRGMMATLKYDVVVAGEDGELVTLPKDTAHTDLSKSVLDQLSPDHFTGNLKDWRPDERQQADRDFLERKVKEQEEREAAKAARTKADRIALAKQRIEADQQLIADLESEE